MPYNKKEDDFLDHIKIYEEGFKNKIAVSPKDFGWDDAKEFPKPGAFKSPYYVDCHCKITSHRKEFSSFEKANRYFESLNNCKHKIFHDHNFKTIKESINQ